MEAAIEEFKRAVQRVVPQSEIAKHRRVKRVKYKVLGRYNVRCITPKYRVRGRYNVQTLARHRKFQ